MCYAYNVNEHVMQKGAVLKLHLNGLQTPLSCTYSRLICHGKYPHRLRQREPLFTPFMYCGTSSASATRVLVVAVETAISPQGFKFTL